MTQVVPSNVDHADLRVRLERGATFGDADNQETARGVRTPEHQPPNKASR
jgi:hypothetical protein